MRTVSIVLVGLLLWSGLGQAQMRSRIGEGAPKTAPDPTPEYVAFFEEARKLFAAGKLDEAKAQVEVVLAKYPHYSPAVTLRAQLERSIRSDTSREVRQRLERIVIPRVKFRDALVESALDYLRDESRRIDRKGVNIVVLLPDAVKKRKISLDLIDARALDVLEYLAEGGGFQYRIDRSAVVVTARETGTGSSMQQVATAPLEPALPELPPIPGAP